MMKLRTLIFTLAVTCLSACIYDVPIIKAHDIPIDRTLLGAWISVPEDGDDSTRMQVLEFSKTEYLVHYFEGNEGLYFRAYPIRIKGVEAVQLELIGDEDEALGHDDKDRFMVASVRVLDDKLEVKTLNTELVSRELTDSQSLLDAFVENTKNPELFNNPGFFRRLERD